ncbi:hypothetical protein [Paracoccus aminovorans]|uniref:hypothetical protein n=1 Tax=Paracoccus aminovorans TaxID=34004 RepID=UPI002B25D5C9|nr:hypothetical protein [Paracoccus aminovorans]
MAPTIRSAQVDDLDQVADLLMADAECRNALDPQLWRLDQAAREKIRTSVSAAMDNPSSSFRQKWLVAEWSGRLVGVAHSILLPVPPIYAGDFGPPGLIMEDCFVAPDSPFSIRHDLLKAAEDDLTEAGARILLASSVEGGEFEQEYVKLGYVPLTRYFAKTGLTNRRKFPQVRDATRDDVSGIVAASAIHRRVLHEIHHLFWKPHKDADSRFNAWMNRSLTLEDRDLFVSDNEGQVRGYAISHPATPLHFPTPHDISGVGVIDDFFHHVIENTQILGSSAQDAVDLFEAAEAARARRGDHSILVVCPAAWESKIGLLERMGYKGAITWHIKIRN